MLRNIIIFFEDQKKKRSKIITQQLKATEKPNVTDIKSANIEHLKHSHKLFKTTRQTEKVSQVGSGKSSTNPLHSETKSENFLNEKNVKITKRSHAFKRYASSYVEILNSFNPELQLKDTESAIKNHLIDLLNKLKGFNS